MTKRHDQWVMSLFNDMATVDETGKARKTPSIYSSRKRFKDILTLNEELRNKVPTITVDNVGFTKSNSYDTMWVHELCIWTRTHEDANQLIEQVLLKHGTPCPGQFGVNNEVRIVSGEKKEVRIGMDTYYCWKLKIKTQQ